MTTLNEYAALSAYVYNDKRGGANNQTATNRLQLPSSWTELKDTQVDALVSAMVAFAPPAAGQTTLPTSYQTALQPVLAANWR